MNNHYELLYIVSLHHTGDDLTKVISSVAKVIKDNNGEITLDNIIGKQRLAYPIKKEHQGTFVVVEFDLPREKMLEINKQLSLMPEILRHLTVIKKVKTAEEIEREQKVQEKMLKRKEDELAELEGEATEKTTERKEKPATEINTDKEAEPVLSGVEGEISTEEKVDEKEIEEVEIKEKKEKSKASLDDLDKKLDEILTDDII